MHEVGPAVARALRRPILDVTRRLRDCRGIIDLDLTEVDAEIVQGILERNDIPSKVAPSELVPSLEKPVLLLDADPVREGVEIQQVAGPSGPGLLPWGRVKIAAVGTVTFTPILSPGSLATGVDPDQSLPGGLGDLAGVPLPSAFAITGLGSYHHRLTNTLPAPRRKPRPETVHCLDLLTTGPVPRFRVVASRFVYDYLGDRMKLSSGENFRTLLEDIARYSPGTLLSGTMLSFLEDPKSRHHRFGSGEEFDAYVRWLAAWEAVFEEA